MADFSKGELVFVPCLDDEAFVAGEVVGCGRDDTVTVQLVPSERFPEGETRHVARSEVRHRFARGDGSTSQDNTSLVHMNDATILQNLNMRHGQDQIYTYTASVLLAVNPYKEIHGLYGDEQCALYRGKHIGALPPHPYAIADTSYRALVRDKRNQALLISGESGAGKTETAKIVMQYLSYASGASSDLAARIQSRVLRAQPILESFGNAVTMRNSNSSRFGKYNRVFFDATGALADAGITTYLLESSRVVVHGERERTYHCFYEILSGLDDAKLEAFQLERGKRYRLMSSGQSLQGFEERDKKNFKRLCDALCTVGLDEDSINDMMRVLAGLMHLGDVPRDELDLHLQVDKDDDEARAVDVDEQSLQRAARLLGMDADVLCATLKRKKVAVPGRNSFHEVPRTPSQFRQALHSLIKALYKRLFERTVQRINESFSELRPQASRCAEEAGGSAWQHIGILDIYGFERLQRNSFEQLCINLANERLQHYFVENVLVAEQSLYKREGLPWVSLALPDSQPVVSCITQVFRTLDEYSQQLAKGFETANDEKFCQKTVDEATKDPQRKDVVKQLKMSGKRRGSTCPGMNEGFSIRHYAGHVEYNTRGWLDKNNDRLLTECEALICSSSCSLVKSLGEEDHGKAVFRSISKKYVADLEVLLKTLGTCSLHYIRCFKPNDEQKPNLFNNQQVLDQIVQCGTIELVKLMHDGYPNRCSFEEITGRFRDLLPERFQRYGMRTFIEALMLAYEVPKQEYALGMSRLFLKAGQLRALENMRSGGTKPKAENLSKIVSGVIRKRWGRAGNAVRLCNYIPKFIAEIKERKLRARRRLLSAFHAVRLAQALWFTIRERRAEKLARVFRLAAFLRIRTRPWLAAARERARAAAERRLALLEEEEKRRRVEQEGQWRMEEERRRIEEERARLQLEQRQRIEEQQQQELEHKRQEQRRAEERRRLDEDRKHLEEERQAFEEQRRLSILAQASPQHAKGGFVNLFAGEEGAHTSSRAVESASSDGEKRSGTTAHVPLPAGEEDDVYPGDSVSAAMVTSQAATLVQQEVALQMNERIKALEDEMARKQEEVMQQMRFLQQKNENLERTLEEQRMHKEAGAGCAVSYARRNGSDGEPSPLSLGTPQSATTHLSSKKASHYSRSSRRHSLMDFTSTGRRQSTSSKASTRQKRLSIAHEALSAMREEGAERPRCLGDAPGRTRDIYSQRKWWAQQRQFLLEDLHPNGSPGGAFGQTPGKWAKHTGQASVAGQLKEEESLPNAGVAATTGTQAGSCRSHLTHAAVGPMAGYEVRNLNGMFDESAEDELSC